MVVQVLKYFKIYAIALDNDAGHDEDTDADADDDDVDLDVILVTWQKKNCAHPFLYKKKEGRKFRFQL